MKIGGKEREREGGKRREGGRKRGEGGWEYDMHMYIENNDP